MGGRAAPAVGIPALARPTRCLSRGPPAARTGRREEERGEHGGLLLLCVRRRGAQHPRDPEAGNKGSAPVPAAPPAPSGDGVPRLRGAQRLRPEEERPVSQRRGGKAELDHGLQVSRRALPSLLRGPFLWPFLPPPWPWAALPDGTVTRGPCSWRPLGGGSAGYSPAAASVRPVRGEAKAGAPASGGMWRGACLRVRVAAREGSLLPPDSACSGACQWGMSGGGRGAEGTPGDAAGRTGASRR